MKVIYQGKLNRVGFTFAQGDLFDAEVDAIVNSEQTDFILSRNPGTISGQIRHRFGQSIQDEMDLATQGQVLRAGTVVITSGGKAFERIYHAGFHDPEDWPDEPGASSYADYLESVGTCIDQVFDAALARKLRSVAFPLIGCGVFGLDEKMLVMQFLDALDRFDARLRDGESLQVWLVIRDRDQFDSVVGLLLGLLLEHRGQTVAIAMEHTGVSILDRFAEKLARRANEDWTKWQLCRFAETALEIMFCGLCRASDPSPTPESVFEEGAAATFGLVRKHALKLASEPAKRIRGVWGAEFFAEVLRDKFAGQALEAVNVERNNLAHGKIAKPVGELRKLVAEGLRLKDWAAITVYDGQIGLAEWVPWVFAPSGTSGRTGLFERWQKNTIRYLVPDTGEVIKVPRKT